MYLKLNLGNKAALRLQWDLSDASASATFRVEKNPNSVILHINSTPSYETVRFYLNRVRSFNDTSVSAGVYSRRALGGGENRAELTVRQSSGVSSSSLQVVATAEIPSRQLFDYETRFNKLSGYPEMLRLNIGNILR
jgi:hypothetical protein